MARSKVLSQATHAALLGVSISGAPLKERDRLSDEILEHDAALRALLARIVATWPRVVGGKWLCSACGNRCPDGDKCLLPELQAAGALDAAIDLVRCR